ncbi:MAG: DUF2157 domain-containing protein [Arcticibacter sp.]
MNNNELRQLVEASVITEETADRIRHYYQEKKGDSKLTLFTVFGILASLLVGLGIILIIAHNWDQLTKGLKLVLAFIPLVAAQGLCLYVLLRKNPPGTAWREGSATFLFFSLGACIALISQMYHISGDIEKFLFVWMFLCLPVIYLMQSSVTSLLYLCGITWYALASDDWSPAHLPDFWYWLMFSLAMPHYYALVSRHPKSNFTGYHNWIIPLSLSLGLATVSHTIPQLMYIAYMSLFAVFYLSGHLLSGTFQRRRNNPYLLLGSLGTITLLLYLSFEEFWTKLLRKDFYTDALLRSPELLASLILTGAAILLAYKSLKLRKPKPMDMVFAVFILVFLAGTQSMISVVFINVIILICGMMIIREGARSDNLGVLNYGLLIISALTACRFFDTDLSFVLRGLIFITVGIVIFILNTWMLKRRT